MGATMAEPGPWRIAIPRWHPVDLNTLLKASVRERARLKRLDRDMVIGYTLLCRVPPAHRRKRRVTLTYVRGRGQKGPVPDVDALWKSTLDALVAARVLRDDSPAWAEILPVRFDRADVAATFIDLEDIDL